MIRNVFMSYEGTEGPDQPVNGHILLRVFFTGYHNNCVIYL